MWFGNLVTMRWWDDLWLNESFAEWASTTCQAEATHWTDAWTTFATHEKDWAYRQDQLSSTHPIVAEINDLQDVEVNFDGITYAKGASVLKQLVAYVGRDAFRDGIRAYFATHAWGNTTLDDLLDRARDHLGARPALVVQALARDRRGRDPAPRRRGRRPRPHLRGRRRPDLRPGLRDLPAAPPRHRPLRPPRRRPAPHRPHRGRRRRRAHRAPRARGAPPARPSPRQRGRPRLRQDPLRRAIAGHRPVAPARVRSPRCRGPSSSPRPGT